MNAAIFLPLMQSLKGFLSGPELRKVYSGPLGAVFLCLSLVISFIVIGFYQINLSHSSSSSFLSFYQPAIAAVATLITRNFASQIQSLRISNLNAHVNELQNIREGSEDQPEIEDQPTTSQPNASEGENLDSLYRSILQMPTYGDWGKQWGITIFYLINGLVTTSFTSRLSPDFCRSSSTTEIQTPNYYFDSCVNVTASNTAPWRLNDTHALKLSNDYRCPYMNPEVMLASINTRTPDDAVYFDGTTKIQRGAIGATSVLYGDNNHNHVNISGMVWNWAVRSCVPILHSNPVSCQQNFNVTDQDAAGNFTVYAELDDGINCTTTFHTKSIPEKGVVSFCQGRDIGKAAMTWTSTGAVAAILSAAVGIPRPDWALGPFSVICTVDTTNAFNMAEISVDSSGTLSRGDSSTSCIGSDSISMSPTLTPALYAAAYSLKQLKPDPRLWSVKLYDPGYEIYNPRNTSTFAFKTSDNALEDVLGVLIGITASRMGSFGYGRYSERQLRPLRSKSDTVVYAIGCKGWYSLFYAAPPLVTGVLLIRLLSTVPKGEEFDTKLTSLTSLLKFNPGESPERQGEIFESK